MKQKSGRPRVYTEPRDRVVVFLPTALVQDMDKFTENRTAFIESALRERVEREKESVKQ